MYTIYTANVNGDEVEQGHYVDFAGGFSEARRIVETKGDLCDGLYDCFMIKDYSIYWLLKPNEGGWDYFYSFGAPLVVSDDDLTISWSDFEYDADKEKLEKAKKAARNGSYQAIYDAYQALDTPQASYSAEIGAFGAGLAGLGYSLSDYGASDFDFGLDSYDFGSGYSDFTDFF